MSAAGAWKNARLWTYRFLFLLWKRQDENFYWNFGSQVTSHPSRWKVFLSISESMTVE